MARTRRRMGCVLAVAMLPLSIECHSLPRGSTEKNDLSSMQTVVIEIVGRARYTAYVADSKDQGGRTVQLGLMNVTEAELPRDRGMIFVFPGDDLRNFWMRNTIIPLDIAYIRSDGTIVKTYTMEPLNEAGYLSIEPARFALEVRAGEFERWGVVEGDHVNLPASLFGD